MTTTRIRSHLVLAFVCFAVEIVQGFPVERRILPGLWKLTFDDPRKALITDEEEITLKIQGDGSFCQCDEGCIEGRLVKGRWELQENLLLLAVDRQYLGPSLDILLTGKFDNEREGKPATDNNDIVSCLSFHGDICHGKFMYPKIHPSFFEQPLAQSDLAGTFSIKQVMSFHKFLPVEIPEERTEKQSKSAECKAGDFYERRFYLDCDPSGIENDAPVDDGEMTTPVIAFFANNTFVIQATNKILRGRFEVDENNNKMWFKVSLFGSGRSKAGSVYSEGFGLTYEDERSYKGEIKKVNDRLYIEGGTVTFGQDDMEPQILGTFSLKEVKDSSPVIPDEDDNILFENAFQ